MLIAQFAVATLGAQGRLTSAYLMLLLSLALPFVLPSARSRAAQPP